MMYDDYQRGSASMFFDEKATGSDVAAEPSYQLANELHKQIIRKFKRRKVYSSFRDNIWGADFADMQSLSKYNKGITYLLCGIDFFSKYAWVVHLKDKRGITVVNAFQKIISKGPKPNKIWVDQGGEFYNNLLKGFLKINNTEMYSAQNEGKSVIGERFIRTLKTKVFKHMTASSKNVYFDVLDHIVNKYNNTVHRTIKTDQLTLHLILMLNKMKILTKKILNLKLVMVSEYQSTETFLLNDTLKIGQKKFLLSIELKKQFRGHTRFVT